MTYFRFSGLFLVMFGMAVGAAPEHRVKFTDPASSPPLRVLAAVGEVISGRAGRAALFFDASRLDTVTRSPFFQLDSPVPLTEQACVDLFLDVLAYEASVAPTARAIATTVALGGSASLPPPLDAHFDALLRNGSLPLGVSRAGAFALQVCGQATLALGGLSPDAEYAVVVRGDPGGPRLLAFRALSPSPTAPPASVLATSCDRYLHEARSGEPRDTDDDDVDAHVLRIVREHQNRDATLLLGDQVYADGLVDAWRAALSRARPVGSDAAGRDALVAGWARVLAGLPTASDAAEAFLGAVFDSLYRIAWGRAAMRAFFAVGAHVAIPDDHDFINNADNTTWAEPHWRPLLAAGVAAHTRFQRALLLAAATHEGTLSAASTPSAPATPRRLPPTPPPPTHALSARVWAGVGVLMLDTRLPRILAGPASLVAHSLLGADQWRLALATLSAWAADPAVEDIVIASATPLMAIPPLLARVVDAAEAERYMTHPWHLRDLLRLIDALRAAGKVRVVVGGDVHMTSHIDYCPVPAGATAAGRAGERPADDCLPQLVTSGLTRGSTALQEKKLFAFDWVASFLSSGWVPDPRPVPPTGAPDELGAGPDALDALSSGAGYALFLRSVALTRNHGQLWLGRGAARAAADAGPAVSPDTWAAARVWGYGPAGTAPTRAAAAAVGGGGWFSLSPSAWFSRRLHEAWLWPGLHAAPHVWRTSGGVAWRSVWDAPPTPIDWALHVAFQHSQWLVLGVQLYCILAAVSAVLRRTWEVVARQ